MAPPTAHPRIDPPQKMETYRNSGAKTREKTNWQRNFQFDNDPPRPLFFGDIIDLGQSELPFSTRGFNWFTKEDR